MPIPEFIVETRKKIGTDLMWVPAVCAVVLRDATVASPWAVPEVLLVRRADNGERVTAAAILGVGAHGPVTHANGDKASYMTVQLRCEPLDPTVEPVVGDDENTEAGWFPISQMPVRDPKWRLAIADAASQRRHPGSFAPRMGLTKR